VTFVRTNVVLDRQLVEQAMETYGFTSIRETIDYALRRLVTPDHAAGWHALHGVGWDGDLEALRGGPLDE
jgi:Arc/MetJ family transcription regulator